MNNPNYSGMSNQGYQPVPPRAPINSMAIASLVCGIIAIILFWIPYVNIASLVLSIIGIVCGATGMKKARLSGTGNGMAVAGLVISIIALVFSAIGLFTCTICVCTAENAARNVYYSSF